jgi:hypothetical protein
MRFFFLFANPGQLESLSDRPPPNVAESLGDFARDQRARAMCPGACGVADTERVRRPASDTGELYGAQPPALLGAFFVLGHFLLYCTSRVSGR